VHPPVSKGLADPQDAVHRAFENGHRPVWFRYRIARSILRDLRKPEIGSAVWSRFGGRPKEDTLWYYRELASAFQDLLPGQLAEELMEIVIVLENE
jgi:hypothetical protein